MRNTKNKYLRKLVKRIDYESSRPKGVKLLDLMLISLPYNDNSYTLFVSEKIHKETNYLKEYKGFKVKSAVLKDYTVIFANESNMYYE